MSMVCFESTTLGLVLWFLTSVTWDAGQLTKNPNKDIVSRGGERCGGGQIWGNTDERRQIF